MAVLGYPLETVLAEKIATAISLGDTNTRMKDYADIWTLTGRHDFAHHAVRDALLATATHRGIALQPLSTAIPALATLRTSAFDAYRRSLAVDGAHLPTLVDVIHDVTTFADPLLGDQPSGPRWDATSRAWR